MRKNLSLAFGLLLSWAVPGMSFANPAENTAATAAPAASAELNENEAVFQESLQNILPLTPEQIESFRSLKSQINEAENAMPVASIHTQSRPLSFETGKTVAPIVLTPMYVGAVSFFDMTGVPWPVSRVVIGNEELFKLINSEYSKDEQRGDSHTLYITPLRDHANSNILVFLEGATAPLSIPLVSSPADQSKRRHDGMTNFVLSARSPFAKAPVITAEAPATSPVMYAMLDGLPPQNATLRKTSLPTEECLVVELDNKLYVRTKFPLVFPAFRASAQVAGTYVYEIAKTPSILISRNGHSLTVDIN